VLKPFADPASGFTLIELILVMAILTISVSITAPALSNFFHSRTLDSEARRLLSLTREGQSRAESEGIPMELWFNAQQPSYGLEAEPDYQEKDPKAVVNALEGGIQLSVSAATRGSGAATGMGIGMEDSAFHPSSTAAKSNHPNLPRIRFLPDGRVDDNSPEMVRLMGGDGSVFWLVLSKNRLNYELRSQSPL
jgi:type II secretion system protein H